MFRLLQNNIERKNRYETNKNKNKNKNLLQKNNITIEDDSKDPVFSTSVKDWMALGIPNELTSVLILLTFGFLVSEVNCGYEREEKRQFKTNQNKL